MFKKNIKQLRKIYFNSGGLHKALICFQMFFNSSVNLNSTSSDSFSFVFRIKPSSLIRYFTYFKVNKLINFLTFITKKNSLKNDFKTKSHFIYEKSF